MTVALAQAEPQQLQAVEPPTVNLAAMFERLALNPEMPVDKLQTLMEMQRRVLADMAKVSFATAFAKMQAELPIVTERSKGHNDKKYAALEDIVSQVRPVLTKHGFSLSHRTEWPDSGVRVVGILTHQDGYERESVFQAPADKSGSKNDVQALGSAMTYGRRYTTLDLLNIVSREGDDDGQRAGRRPPPEGFDDWREALVMKASEGLPALQAMWKVANDSPDLKLYAKYLTETEPGTWNALKTTAAKVGAK